MNKIGNLHFENHHKTTNNTGIQDIFCYTRYSKYQQI